MLLLSNIYHISYMILSHISYWNSNKLPFRNDEIHDIDCKSLSSLVNLVCYRCLNHNVLVLEYLNMFLVIFGFVGQIAYH